jgi:hypothetical protein
MANGHRGGGVARRAFWESMVQRQRDSGLSVREFCRRHKVSESSLYRWRRLTASPGASRSPSVGQALRDDPASAGGFVSLGVLAPDQSLPSVEVVLDRPMRLVIPSGFDPSSLRQLLAVLAEAPLVHVGESC